MRLSEAGLLGGMETEQHTGSIMRKGKTCFLGGALVAIGAIHTDCELSLKAEENAYVMLKAKWPILKKKVSCPKCDYHIREQRLDKIIWGLNDYHKWTRPQIAEWLRGIEDQFESKLEIVEAPKQVEQVTTNQEVLV